jgi:hypothetical protein
MANMKYTDKDVEKLLRDIYDGSVTPYDLPEDLYIATANYLKDALFKGFGGDLSDFTGTKESLLTELRENIYMFSSAKTFQEVKELSSQLVNEDGNIRTFGEFQQIGRQTFSTWNDDWGKSEYNTAVGQATMANKWDDIEAKKDILPNLRFVVTQPCPICEPLSDLVAPVDDEVWNWATPLLHFNCMCLLLQEDADVQVSDKDKFKEVEDQRKNISDVFQMNPGKDKVIFSPEHPYFDVAKKDKEYAKDNFGLPIPDKD